MTRVFSDQNIAYLGSKHVRASEDEQRRYLKCIFNVFNVDSLCEKA